MKIQVKRSTLDNIASKIMMDHANDGFSNNAVEPHVFDEMAFALNVKRVTNGYSKSAKKIDFVRIDIEFVD
jgi:hypothetical protein